MKRREVIIGSEVNLLCKFGNGRTKIIRAKITNARIIKVPCHYRHIIDTKTKEDKRISFQIDKRRNIMTTTKGPKVMSMDIVVYN